MAHKATPMTSTEAIAVAGDLALALMPRRGRADDQHALDAEEPGHVFGRGDGLDGLAEPHVVAEEGAAGAGGEEDALALVVVEIDLEQVLERGTAGAARKRLGDLLPPPVGIAHLGDEGEHVVLETHLVLARLQLFKKRVEAREGVGQQGAVGAEIACGDTRDRLRTVDAGPEAHLAARAVLEIDLAVVRLESRTQSLLAAALAFQRGEGELDVLAGAERVGGEVGAGAVVVA